MSKIYFFNCFNLSTYFYHLPIQINSWYSWFKQGFPLNNGRHSILQAIWHRECTYCQQYLHLAGTQAGYSRLYSCIVYVQCICSNATFSSRGKVNRDLWPVLLHSEMQRVNGGGCSKQCIVYLLNRYFCSELLSDALWVCIVFFFCDIMVQNQ